MKSGALAVSFIQPALLSTVRAPVTAGSSHRRTSLFAAEPSDEHYPGLHAATRRPTARMPYRQEREQTLTASILYGKRKIQYSQHA